MNAVDELAGRIRQAFPDARVEIDRPDDPGGHWFADVAIGSYGLVVEWRPGEGFGLSSADGGLVFGEGPDEVIRNVDEVWPRLSRLLSRRSQTIPPAHLILPRLRERRNLTQADVAAAMNSRQADVSKMERRSDMLVSNLRRLVNAMGGDLELRAVFPDGAVNVIELDQPSTSSRDERETG